MRPNFNVKDVTVHRRSGGPQGPVYVYVVHWPSGLSGQAKAESFLEAREAAWAQLKLRVKAQFPYLTTPFELAP